jgi:hypothetical protein
MLIKVNTLNITIDSTSFQSFAGLLRDLAIQVESEKIEGVLQYEDGDKIVWYAKTKSINTGE